MVMMTGKNQGSRKKVRVRLEGGLIGRTTEYGPLNLALFPNHSGQEKAARQTRIRPAPPSSRPASRSWAVQAKSGDKACGKVS
jgi:hypothetical protein